MAATAISLQLRRNKTIAFRNPSFVQLFSSSSTSDPNVEDQNNASSSSSSPPPPPPPPPQSQSSFSSYFSDVKASLKQPSPQQRQLRKPFSPSPTPLSTEKPPSKVTSLLEIRKNLSEFRLRSTVPPPPASQQISFQELFERNVISKGEESSAKISFDSIRESIKQMQSKNTTNGGGRGNGSMSLSHYRESLKLRPMDPNQRESPMVIGGTNNLPASVFGKEIRDKSVEPSNMKTEFVKMYGYDELGCKLKRLRPEAKGDKWFSLGELNDRLMKLRELEEKEYESRIAGITFKDLRESLVKLKTSDDEKTRKSVIQRLDVLTQIGGTPTFMLAPPKENLVEKYFHPDNMSSSEKMKLELKKVRDEFKMSESDCGSARVQVAQLTTKIKHLSTALHKKDKHSRKGLQAMVQKRKKLLKYLRRTDWDSYCLVLSKLGLRDNPDYKN